MSCCEFIIIRLIVKVPGHWVRIGFGGGHQNVTHSEWRCWLRLVYRQSSIWQKSVEICFIVWVCLAVCLTPPPPLNLQHDLSIQTECAVKDRSILILRLSVDCVSVCLVLSFGQVYICLSVCLFVCTCLFVYRFDRCTNLLFVCL